MDFRKIVRTAFVFPVALLFYSAGLLGIAQADSIYMSVEGRNQGTISSNASPSDRGHENEITVFSFGHSVTIPTDPQSGLPTGRRVHGPLRIFKAFDNSSTGLYQALVTGEPLTEVVIRFWRLDPEGVMEHYWTITLVDALISDITGAAGADDSGTREAVSYVYSRIRWQMEGGTEASDDWQER